MTGIRSWLTSSITLLGTRVSIQVVGAASQLLIIPMLSAPEYGAYILLISLGQLMSPFAHGGLIVPMVTEASSRANHRTVSLTVYLSLYLALWLAVSCVILVITIVASAMGFTALPIVSGLHSPWLLAGFVWLICLANAAELIASQLLIAKAKIWQSTLASGGVRYLFLSILLLYLTFSDNVSATLLVIMLITAVSAALSLGFALAVFLITVRQDQAQHVNTEKGISNGSTNALPGRTALGSIIVRAVESLGSFLFAQLRASAEVLMCTALFGLGVAGVLAAARRISGAVLMISQTLNVVITPYSVRLLQDDDKHTLQKINRLIATFLLLLCGIVLLVTFVALDQQWIAGLESSYDNLGLFIAIMTLGLAARFYSGSAMQILMANAHQRIVLRSYVYDFMASLVIYSLAWIQGDPITMIVLLALSQACQYAWLAQQAQKTLGIRTRWL